MRFLLQKYLGKMLQPSLLRPQDLCDTVWVEGVGLGTNRRAAPCAVAKMEGHNLPSWQSLPSFFAWSIHVRLPFHVCCYCGARASRITPQALGHMFFLLSFTEVRHPLLLFLLRWSHCRCSTLNPSLASCDARVAIRCSHGSLSLSYVIARVEGFTF